MRTRRSFIGLLTLGGLTLGSATLSLSRFGFFKSHPFQELIATIKFKNLSRRNALHFASILKSILSLKSHEEVKASLLKADLLFGNFSKMQKIELTAALEILEQSPLWQIQSHLRFSNLNEVDQIRVLKKWSTGPHPLRALSQGIKEFSVMCFYSLDSSWAEIGYDGPWVGRNKVSEKSL